MTYISTDKQNKLTAEQLRSLVNYDPDIGEMTWRRTRRGARFAKQIGTTTRAGYRIVLIHHTLFMVHRLVWLYVHGRWPLEEIDHKNGNRSDNRLCNLREATRLQNIANRPAQCGRPLKGITQIRGRTRLRARWVAQIRIDGRNVYLGSFATPEEANAVYLAKHTELHGEFAKVA